MPRSRRNPDAPRDAAACRGESLELLARRDHSRLELERKLATRGFTADLIHAVLADLEQSGTFAESRFTAGFVRSRATRGKGPARIRAELAERGIGKAAAAEHLADPDFDWAAAAAAARRKRFGAAPPRDFRERARQARFLQYRGFDAQQIEAALGAADEAASGE